MLSQRLLPRTPSTDSWRTWFRRPVRRRAAWAGARSRSSNRPPCICPKYLGMATCLLVSIPFHQGLWHRLLQQAWVLGLRLVRREPFRFPPSPQEDCGGRTLLFERRNIPLTTNFVRKLRHSNLSLAENRCMIIGHFRVGFRICFKALQQSLSYGN